MELPKTLIVDDDERVRAAIRADVDRYNQKAGPCKLEADYVGSAALSDVMLGVVYTPGLVIIDSRLYTLETSCLLRDEVPAVIVYVKAPDAKVIRSASASADRVRVESNGYIDRTIAIERGADDAMDYPMPFRELEARIRKVCRQRQKLAEQARPRPPESKILIVGPIKVDLSNRVVLKDGQVIELTSREFNLLAAFAEHPTRVLRRNLLLELIYEGSSMPRTPSVIDAGVGKLRGKFGDDLDNPTLFKTVRGVGYMFNPHE